MISTLKAVIVVLIVVGVAVPSAYLAYTYSSSPPIEVTHYIPENSTVVIHMVNNTSDYYGFIGQGYEGLILNYSFNSFSDKAQSLSNSTVSSGKSLSQTNSSVKITSYESYLGNTIYKVVLPNINLSTLNINGLSNISLSGIESSNRTLTLFAAPLGDSYVILGSLNATVFSLATNHFGTYWKNSNDLLVSSSAYDSFYVNLSSVIDNKSFSYLLSSLSNSNSSSFFKVFNKLNYFVIEGNLTNSITNITIQMSNSTLLHQIISFVNYKYGKYVISSANPNPHTATFQFRIGLKDIRNLNLTQKTIL